MDFAWTAEQQADYDRAFAFAQTLPPAMAGFDREAWQRLGESGLLKLCVPAACGGMGRNALDTAYVVEAFGRGAPGAGLVFSACAHLFTVAMPIAMSGSEALRRHCLPRLGSGEWVGAGAMTEPAAGSDLHALQTRAERRDGGYVLNGHKRYITNAPVADVLLVYAATEPMHGYLGLSAFVVESDRPGVRRSPAFEKSGLTGSPVGEVHFEDCRIPEGNRLGLEGEGAKIFQAAMQWERACLFALYLGAMARELDAVVAHARERKQFGKPIGRQQAVSHRIADMALRLEAARLLLHRACWLHDRGDDGAALAASMAKLAVSEAAVQSGLDASRVFGAQGLMLEPRADRGLLDALPSLLFSGSNDIQREIIARGFGL